MKYEPDFVNEDDDCFIVPDHLRSQVTRQKRRNYATKSSELMRSLIGGNTLLVDAGIPLGWNNIPKYKNLYNSLGVRGYRLQIRIFDSPERNIYRGLLMWAEPMVMLWNCSRCGNFEVSSHDTRPQSQKCAKENAAGNYHSWRKVKNTNHSRFKEQFSQDMATVSERVSR